MRHENTFNSITDLNIIWAGGMVLLYIYWPFARLMAWYLMWQWIGIIGIAFIFTVIIMIIMCIQKKIQQRRDRLYYERYNMQYLNEQIANQQQQYLNNSILTDIENNSLFNLQTRLIPFPPPLPPRDGYPLGMNSSSVHESSATNKFEQNLDGLRRLFADPDEEDNEDIEEVQIIDDKNDRMALNQIVERKTLADIFQESKLELKPRLASF